MPIEVVLDQPGRYVARRLWYALSTPLGVLLIVVGSLASIIAVPATLAVLGLGVDLVGGGAEPIVPPDMPVGPLLLAWAVSVPLAAGGMKGGLHLLRHHRRLVLFLRRFGHDEAQAAVTYAVTSTIGRSWRVITLCDAEMAPLGLPATTRLVFRAGHATWTVLMKTAMLLGFRLFPLAVNAGWIIAAIGVLTADTWTGGLETYLDILTSVLAWRLPFDAVAPTLPGLFAVTAIVAALSFVVLGITFAALLMALPLFPLVLFVSSSASAAQEAEQTKTVTAATAGELEAVVPAIVARSRKVFGPRLVVLRVATPVWQRAVVRLASASAVPVVDVSEPTMNVLWEIDELARRFGDRCVFIGHQDRVSCLATAPAGGEARPFVGQLRQMLDGHQVLAYTTDRRGLKRFARALRARLFAVTAD